MSGVEPAANGTTSFTGFAGQSWAAAGCANTRTAVRASNARFIEGSPELLLLLWRGPAAPSMGLSGWWPACHARWLRLYSSQICVAGVVMGLAILILGLAVFIGVHVFVSMRGPRAALIERIGLGPFKGPFSVISLVGFFLIVVGVWRYPAPGSVGILGPPPSARPLANPPGWVP